MVKNKIVFAGALPPPMHGMAAVNLHMISLIKERSKLIAVGVQPLSLRRGFFYYTVKSIRSIFAVIVILYGKIIGVSKFYGSVDDGLGMLWTAIFAGVARAMGFTVFLHHHSYRYIVRKNSLMKMLLYVAGKKAHHIMLCDEMAFSFQNLYPYDYYLHIAPNSVTPPIKIPIFESYNQFNLTIGLLSNLNKEKGLMTFIQIIEECGSLGSVRGVLAGPISNPNDADFVRDAVNRLGDRLIWLGSVSGEEKEKFFQLIDLFVFPTSYETESFGLVILESLVRGKPVIAPARGCICIFDKLESANIVPLDKNFKSEVIKQIQRFIGEPGLIEKIKNAAIFEGNDINNKNHKLQIDAINYMINF